MLIFRPVPAGNIHSQEKIVGEGEGADEGGDLKLISHSYLDTRGCRSSVQPSWCHSNDGPPPPLLWAMRSLSEVSVLYHPSTEACSFDGLNQDIQSLQTSTTNSKNGFRGEDKGSLTHLDFRDGPGGNSAAWKRV